MPAKRAPFGARVRGTLRTPRRGGVTLNPEPRTQNPEAPFGADQIQDIIPHRYPILLVDRIVELELGQRVVGIKLVSQTDPILQGHFPGNPIMPGVLIVEALAQTGAVLALADPAERGRIPYFARIDNCRFRRPVRPGDSLRLEVELQASRGPVGKAHGRALVDDAVVCEADLTFAFG